MAFLLEELILNFSVDTDSLERGLDSVSAKARARAREIERMAIAPKVDLSGLHELNRLLDVKQRHIRETAQFAARNPIVIKVDTRDLSVARRELKGFKDDLGLGSNHKVSVKIEHQYKVDIRESNRDIVSAINGLRNEFKEVAKSSKKSDTPRQQKDPSSDLAKEIKQGFHRMKSGNIFEGIGKIALSPVKAIFTGFYEGIGLTASSKLTKGAIKSIESEWNFTLDALGKGTGKAFGSIGKNAADLLLHSMGTSTEQINEMFEDLSQGFNDIFDEKEARSRIQNIGDTINKTLANAFKNGTFISDDIAELKSAINAYKGLRRENIDKRRNRSVDETARQATEQSGMYDAPDLSSKEKAVLYAGGFAGKNSKTHEQSALMLGKIYGETAQVFQSGNDATNTDASSKDNPVKWMVEATRKITKLNLSGEVNPDVVKMVAQALAIREKNPHITIDLVGHSAGGFIAKDAAAILERLGVENVRGVGIGTPDGVMGSIGRGNYQGILGKDDTVKKIVDNAAILGLTNPSNEASQNMSGIASHSMIDYLSNPDVQSLLTGQSGITKDELLKGLGDDVTGAVAIDIKKNIHGVLKEVGEGTVLIAAAVIKESVKQIQNLVPVAKEVGKGALVVGEGIGTGSIELGQRIIKDRRLNISQNQSVQEAINLAGKEKAIDAKGKPIVFAVGGVVGAGGAAGAGVRKEFRNVFGSSAATVIPVRNDATDSNGEDIAGMLGKGFGGQPYNAVIKGQNPDAVNLAAKIIAARENNPDTDICALGHCGGGLIVEEALDIANKAGVKNITGIGVGTGSFTKPLGVENFQRIYGKNDEMGMSPIPGDVNDAGRLSRLGTHQVSDYLRNPKVMELLPKGMQSEAVKKALDHLQKNIIEPSIKKVIDSEKTDIQEMSLASVDIQVGKNLLVKFQDLLDEDYKQIIESKFKEYEQMVSMNDNPIYQVMAANQAIHQGFLKQQEILLPSVQTIPLRQNIPDVNIKDIDITTIEIKEDIVAIETVQEQIAKINKTINEETKKLLTGGTPTNPDFNVKELSKLGASLLIPKEDGVGFYGATDIRKMKREGMIDFISQNIQPDALKEIIANRGKPLRKFDNADIAKYKEALDTRLREMIKTAQSFEDIEKIQSTVLTLISSIQQTKVLANVSPSQIRQLSGYESQFKKLTNLEGIKFEAKGMGIELPETISKHWDTTAAHISGKMDEIGKKSAEVGYDVQHELSEGSPGLTQRIRDYWDKTIKHIKGKIAELNNSNVSNLEPSAYPIPQINPDIVAKIKERENELQGKTTAKGRAWQIAEAERIMAEKESQLSSITGNNINIRQKNTNNPIQQNTQVTQKIIEDNQIVNNGLDKIGLSFTSLRNQFPIIDNAIAKFNQFKNLIVSIGVAGAGAIGLFLIGKQLTNIATESVKVYRNFESIFIASKTIANGSEFLGKVRKQVKDLGGDLESTMRQGQQFVTGLQGTNLERTAETLFLDSSKALTSLGLQTQQYDSAILAIKQVASKGKVSLEEISGQLGEAVPGALNIAAQAMQTNVQGFIQMVESGNLLSEEFLPKFIARLKAQTAFLEPEIKKSLNASFGRLGANYTDLQLGIGQSLSPVVATFVNTLSNGLEFINNNFDKVLLAVKALAIALAMPAAYQGILLVGKGVQLLTANLIVAKSAAEALGQSIAIAKTLATGGLYVGAALAVTSVVEGAMFLWQNGTQEVKDNTEALKDTVDSIADAYQRAYESASKLNNPQQGTGNWLLDRIDDFINKANSLDAWIAKMTGTKASPNQTFAGAREEQDLAQLNEQKAQIGLGLFYQRKLKDYQETTNYIQQALKLDDEMAGKRAEILAARIKDPVGNANLIKKLEKQIYDKGGLVEQREKINDRFLPGGQAGIEQTIRLTEQSIKLAKDRNQSDEVERLNKLLDQQKSNLAKIQDINSQITSGLNRQRLAYIEMNAEIAKRQDKLQRDSISIDFPVLDARIAGKLGETNSGYLLAVNELKRQQMTVNSLIQDQKNRESFISNKLEVGAKSSVRALINKELEQIDRGDISRLESLLKGNQNSKQAIEEITGTLTAFLDGKQSLLQAQKALKDARLAVIQQSRAIEDFNLELARSIYDFNKGVEAKQSEVTGLYRDWQRRIEDSVYNNKIKVRQLSESYSDLMFNLQTQLSTSSNELINIKNQIISEKRKQENLLISPGADSIARQVNNIFNQLFDSLTNGEQEKRQANLDAAQVQKQYIDTLRQIRQVEEDNIEARKAQSREIEDLTSGYKSLNVQIKEMIEESSRVRQDAIKKYDREGVNVRPYLQADPNFGYNQQVPFSVPMGKPIVSQPAHPTIVISPVEPVKVQAEIVRVKNPEIPIKVTPKVESPNWKKIIGDQLPPIPVKTQPQADNNIVKEYVFKAAESVQKAINTVNPFYAAPAQAATTNKKMGWEKNLARLLNQYGSQMTVEDFKRAAAKSGISIDALVTQAFIESHFGTKGRGRFTKNPLNYGNDDAGNNKHFKTYGDGLEYAAIKLKEDFFFTTPEDFMARDFKGRYGRYATDPAYRNKYESALQRTRQFLYKNQLQSSIPKEFKIAGGISDMGMALFEEPKLMAGNWFTDQIDKFGNYKDKSILGKKRKDWDNRQWAREYVLQQGITSNISDEIDDLVTGKSSMMRGYINWLNKQPEADKLIVQEMQKRYGYNKKDTTVKPANPTLIKKLQDQDPYIRLSKFQKDMEQRRENAEKILIETAKNNNIDTNLITQESIDLVATGNYGKTHKFKDVELLQTDRQIEQIDSKIAQKTDEIEQDLITWGDFVNVSLGVMQDTIQPPNTELVLPPKQIQQQVTTPKDLGIASVPYLTPIPINDFESAKKLADKQREVNTELAKTKSLVADEKMTTSYLEAIDNLTKLEYTLKEANLAKTRSLFDGQEELRQISRNSKGYQTAQEQNQKVGYDIWKSFEDKRRAIQDANFAEELKQTGWTVQKQKLIEDLQAKGINPAYDEQVKTSLNNLDIQMNQSKVLQQQLTIQNQQIDALATQTVQTAMARDNEDRRLNAMKEYGDLQANLASARYNYGGELINNGAVISAQLNAKLSKQELERKLESLQVSRQQREEMLAMTKELADINIKQSYVDAIPFMKQIGDDIKTAVLETNNWGDALNKTIRLIQSTIFDQLVLKPIQNSIANIANDWGLFGNTTPINPPSNAVGIDNGNNFSGSIINASESISTISKVVPEVTQSFTALALSNAQNQVTEQTALMAFSASLQTATLAVMQFSAGLGGQSIMSGLLGQSVTDAASGGYTGILDIPSLFYNGSDCVPNYANGVESALSKERAMSGKKPYLAALHEGEAVLSTLNGDSALYRSLKRSGTWDELKTGDQIPNFAKGTDGGMSQGNRSQSNRQGDRGGAAYTINVNQTIVTPNASSFNSSERQRNQDLMVRINKSVGR